MEALIVNESSDVRLAESALMTPAALALLLTKKYLGASFRGQDPHASKTPNYAAMMYRDDRRAAGLTQVRVSLTQPSTAEARRAKKDMYDAYVRRPSYQDEAMDRSVNHYRW